MKGLNRFVYLVAFSLATLSGFSLAAQTGDPLVVGYTVSFPEPWTQYTEVTMTLEGVQEDTLRLSMAAWTPGSYKIRDYAGQVPIVSAYSAEGGSLPAHKSNKGTWLITTKGNDQIRLNYRVWCGENSVRSPYVDPTMASLIPAGIFMYPLEHDVALRVTVVPNPSWKTLTCALPRAAYDSWTLMAANLDELFDAPIQVGNQTILTFEAAGVDHILAITGEHNGDTALMVKDIAAIAEAATELFGGNPNEEYTFILNNTANNYGGLEHMASTSMIYPRWDYTAGSRYRRFLGLVSHEYIHLWNVKRIRPVALSSFDYSQEVHTRMLWVAEGATQYYDDLLLRRAGIISEGTYLDIAASNLNQAVNRPGDAVQAVSEASHDAWIKYYAGNNNSSNVTVSYYTKGSVLCMLLDLEILAATRGKRRLDDVFQSLYQAYLVNPSAGYTDAEFQKACEKAAGKKLTAFFSDYIYGTVSPDYASYFQAVGAELVDDVPAEGELKLGVSLTTSGDVRRVVSGQPAQAAGLMPGDEILGVDGWRYGGDIRFFLERHTAGDTMVMSISREGILLELPVPLFLSKVHRYRVQAHPDATPQQAALYRQWLALPDSE